MRLVHSVKHRSIPLLGGVLTALLLTNGAGAEINITQEDDQVQVEIKDEPIKEIVAKLAEHFNFAVEGEPTHWSDEALSFDTSGDLESVLNTILADTSHVYGYQTKAVGGPAHIASVKLLNIGIPGPMFESKPANQGPQDTVNGSQSAGLPPGDLPRANRSLTEAADRRSTTSDGADEEDQSVDSNADNPRVASSRGSSLSQSLEQRARQATGEPSSVGATSAADADIRSLTQRALQDVQNLADALRNNEQGNN